MLDFQQVFLCKGNLRIGRNISWHFPTKFRNELLPCSIFMIVLHCNGIWKAFAINREIALVILLKSKLTPLFCEALQEVYGPRSFVKLLCRIKVQPMSPWLEKLFPKLKYGVNLASGRGSSSVQENSPEFPPSRLVASPMLTSIRRKRWHPWTRKRSHSDIAYCNRCRSVLFNPQNCHFGGKKPLNILI